MAIIPSNTNGALSLLGVGTNPLFPVNCPIGTVVTVTLMPDAGMMVLGAVIPGMAHVAYSTDGGTTYGATGAGVTIDIPVGGFMLNCKAVTAGTLPAFVLPDLAGVSGYAQVSGNDAGAATDNGTMSATGPAYVTGNDSGAGTDSGTVGSIVPLPTASDTGAGGDSGTLIYVPSGSGPWIEPFNNLSAWTKEYGSSLVPSTSAGTCRWTSSAQWDSIYSFGTPGTVGDVRVTADLLELTKSSTSALALRLVARGAGSYNRDGYQVNLIRPENNAWYIQLNDRTSGSDSVIGTATTFTAWATGTSYHAGDVRNNGGAELANQYICVTDHTSGTFATDLAAGKWQVLSNFGVQVTGTGTATRCWALVNGIYVTGQTNVTPANHANATGKVSMHMSCSAAVTSAMTIDNLTVTAV